MFQFEVLLCSASFFLSANKNYKILKIRFWIKEKSWSKCLNSSSWRHLLFCLSCWQFVMVGIRNVFCLTTILSGKVFDRCEFARELVNKQGFARATVGNWVCLANVRIFHWLIFLYWTEFLSMNPATTLGQPMTTPMDLETMVFSRYTDIITMMLLKNCFVVQINDNYWCDANVGYGADCSVACNNLLDSNISDDCSCAKIIWQRHGFDAW